MSERMKGVVIGLVTDVEDPEEMGRVRVRFPWLSDDNVSDWARVATALASSSLGMYFQPEVGDEALVAFEMDDIRRPYILGFLWNGDNQPPATDVNLRMIQTVSGHKLIFDDTSGSEAIKIEDSNGNKITLDANGVTIESAKDVTIKGQNVNIEATAKYTLKGNPIHLNP